MHWRKMLLRFLGMYAPFQNIRVIMYRKAGVKIGTPLVFGSHIFLDVIYTNITIEDDVILAGYDYIISHSYILHGYKLDEGGIMPVVIKKGARLGLNVTVIPGVTIGENAVVAAGAVVIRNVPANCLVAGVPAKVKKKYHHF